MRRDVAWAMAAMSAMSVLAAACGGAEQPASAPSSNEAAPASNGGVGPSDTRNYVAPPSTAAAQQQPKSPEIAGARSELDRAEAQLSSSLGDCAAACRALASMERAADHLCALDGGAECTHARQRVEAARERVRSTCGGCAR